MLRAAAAPMSSFPTGTTPQQMRHFYGLDAISFNGVTGDGSGQTIALVEAYDAPSALSDLQTFDARFGLPDPPSFQRLNQIGGTTLPSAQSPGSGDWNVETSLDIQWAHVIAPAANIVVIECNTNADINLYRGAMTAAHLPGVVAVSMSFGGGESSFDPNTNSDFVTPAGHAGVTFLASTGDNGSASAFYPAFAPNVVAVGGTSIHLGSGAAYGSEQGWAGSGGGTSNGIEPEPSYQQSVQSTGWRTIPDVSMDADPGTGVPVFDSYDFPSASGASWIQLGGTSLSAPMWAGIIALVDQGRSTIGLSSLDGATQTLPKLYSLPRADFHDITAGSNGGFSATVGYDQVTGLGTPVGNLLVRDLAGLSAPAPPNDNFANAVHLTGEAASAQGTNVGATLEPGEPLDTITSAGQSVWYSWVAPAHAGQVTVSTSGSTFDTTLGIYTGSSVSGLSLITSDGNDQPQAGVNTSQVTFQATPGTTYLISVDGSTTSSTPTGTIHLSVAAAPDNDNFFSATTLSGTTANDVGFNINATPEPQEPNSAGVAGTRSVWWSWTAPAGLTSAIINTQGSDFANTLGVYTGSSPDALSLVADARANASNATTVTFPVVANTTYAIMINGVLDPSAGTTAQGHIHLNLSTTAPQVASVVGRYLFYNDSAFDGNNTAVNPADDAAVAPDKQPLLPGNVSSFANYSSYSRGINGIMIDVSGLPSGTAVSASDFTFLMGNGGDPGTWVAAPAPAAVVDRAGAGAFGADRIEITWPNHAIQNTWLQIVMNADRATGLAAPDVFYFGNAIGESGNSTLNAIVDANDELAARNDPHSFLNPADLTNVHDYNRDGRVDAADQLIARNNATTASTALALWTAPPNSGAPAAHAVAQPIDPWETLKRRLVVRLRNHTHGR